METKQLYKMSKYIRNEGLYYAQIERSGINQDRVKEKLEANPDFMNTTAGLIKFIPASNHAKTSVTRPAGSLSYTQAV